MVSEYTSRMTMPVSARNRERMKDPASAYGSGVIYTAKRLLVVFYGLWLLAMGVLFVGTETSYQWGGFFIASAIGASALWAAYVLVRRYPFSMLTPLPLMFGFMALHFGVGPWFHIMEPNSPESASVWLGLDTWGFFRVQLLNLAGFTCLFIGMAAAQAVRWKRPRLRFGQVRESRPVTRTGRASGGFRFASFSDRALLRAWYLFAVTAFVVRGANGLLGIDILALLPGFLNVIDKFGWVAVLLGGILAGRRGGVWWLLVFLPLGVEAVQGALRLRKSMVLIPVALGFIGLYLSGRSIRTLLAGAMVVTVLFFAIKPIFDTGRGYVWSRETMSATDFLSQSVSGNIELREHGDGLDAGWARLDYTPVQFGLMEVYDKGQAGDTFAELPWMFVPRFLSMGTKPILDFGARTTQVLFGHKNSSTGPTIFGEAYWNGGWLLVVLASLASGAILFAIGWTNLWLLQLGTIFAWPLVFMGMMSGQLLTNMFTKGLVGTAVVFFLLVASLKVFLNSRRKL